MMSMGKMKAATEPKKAKPRWLMTHWSSIMIFFESMRPSAEMGELMSNASSQTSTTRTATRRLEPPPATRLYPPKPPRRALIGLRMPK